MSGRASITQSGNVTDVRQSSADVSIDWLSFSIGAQASVDFLQPSASAIAVNRILGNNGSQILGHLDAIGQVYVINPNGIIFGQGAQVNVDGLVAATLDVSGSSIGASTRGFSGDGTGSIVNQGTINAAVGGYVVLLGNRVGNQGAITAKLGAVALGAGTAATLTFDGNSLVKMQVDQSALNNLAENGGLIQADGGRVIMSAGAQNALLASVVNNTGVIEARTVENRDGAITLLGGMTAGTVNVGGTLDASAPTGGNGGFIETSAAHVEVANGTQVTTAASRGLTGRWLIDPQDFTIAASGGDITGAALSSELGTTSVTILSSNGATAGSGNINVDDTVSWSANTLTLTAANNINVNAVMTATGSAALALNPSTANGADAAVPGGTVVMGLTGSGFIGMVNFSGTGRLSINGAPYTVINSLGAAGSTTGTDLQGMNGNLSADYVLGSNIDATATSTWNGGAGFAPIGTSASPFTGIFDGLGHAVSNLYINRATASNVGLFGYATATAVIRNVGLIGGTVSGGNYVGELVGTGYGATINNTYATGNVTGTFNVGGLVGTITGCFMYCGGSSVNGTVSNSYATGAVSGSSNVGGLVGSGAYSYVSNNYATGAVTGSSNVGGLVGINTYGAVSNSHASGKVSGSSSSIGGLLGYNYTGDVINSFATGSVTGSSGSSGVGGLVGFSTYGPTFNNTNVSNSYATGIVTGGSGVGGLVGVNGSFIYSSYSTGRVSGSSEVGGLVGTGGGVTNGYWNTTTSGQSTSSGGTGLTTAQMQVASNFSGFTFTTTPGASGNNWVMVDANGTLNNAGGAAGAVFPMLASEYATTINNAHQLQLMAMNVGANYTLGGNINAAGTGSGGDVWGSAGFIPIGNSSAPFIGEFNGQEHTISNLTIYLPVGDYVGLFGFGRAPLIENVGLLGGSVTGSSDVGGLLGYTYGGQIINSHAAGNIVKGSTAVGGLVGLNSYGYISNSYATGSVSGTYYVGGLVGYNQAILNDSYATGSVSGTYFVGGLVGYNGGPISNAYATGSVSGASGSEYVGGLVGYNNATYGTVSNSYATGTVTGTSSLGGLVGYNTGTAATVTNGFWDITTTNQSTSAGGTGLTTAQMQAASSFTGWSIATTGGSGDVWRIYQGNTFPLLLSFLTPLTLADTTVTYDGSTQYGATTNLSGILGTAAAGTNVGVYNGYYSSQQGYDISGGTLSINQLASVAWVGGTTGNWSTASNWKGGAIPDYSNVAAVTIPSGVTVTYDSGVPGSTSLASLTDSGNLLMAAGSLGISGNLSTGGFNQTGGTLQVGGSLTIQSTSSAGVTLGDLTAGSLNVTSQAGAIAQSALTAVDVAGATNLIADNGLSGTGDTKYGITLAKAGNSFGGAVSANGSNVHIIDGGAGGLVVGNIVASGTLIANASAGTLTQAPLSAVNITGTTTLIADNGVSGTGDEKYDITFAKAGNNFGGAVSVNGSAVHLIDSGASGLLLGNGTITGTLIAKSTAGAIRQSAGTALDVTGATTLIADNGLSGAGDLKYGITLANATNNFIGAVSADGSNIDLVDGTGGIVLGNTTASGALTVDSLGGAITQVAAAAVSVSGASSLTADNGLTGASEQRYAVTLAQAGDSFAGTVTADGSAIKLKDQTALTAVLDSSGAATLTAAGAMEVSGTVGTTLSTTTTGAQHATTFGATTVGKSLTVVSTGTVTETSSNILTVDGKGTTTVSNPHVTVNGVKGAEIPAP